MDNYVLYGRGGASPVNIGSYLNAGEGQPDFDLGNVFRTRYVENAGADDAYVAFSTSGKRAFRFPLLLAGAPTQIDLLSSIVRSHLRSGEGYIDLQPEGIPSAAAVRFDVLGGQLVDQYSTFLQNANRRRAALELGVRPFGYWPTSIILATSAHATGPLQLTWNPASVIGDAPGPAQLVVSPTYTFVGSVHAGGFFQTDGFGWSLSRASGATVLLAPEDVGQWFAATAANTPQSGSNPIHGATYTTDQYAPIGRFLRLNVSPTFGRWGQMAAYRIGGSMAPLYEGRYRVFAYARSWPSQANTVAWQLAADVVSAPSGFSAYAFMASQGPVATLLPAGNASYRDTVSTPSGVFQVVDLGEHAIPGASSLNRDHFVRLWAKPGNGTNMGVATPYLDFAGFYLLPVHGHAGILPKGIIYPSWSNFASSGFQVAEAFNTAGKVELNAITGRAWRYELHDSGGASPGWPDIVGTEAYVRDLGGFHRGALPYVAPGSAGSLDVVFWGHRTGQGATNAIWHGGNTHQHGATLRYRPQFAFMRGL